MHNILAETVCDDRLIANLMKGMYDMKKNSWKILLSVLLMVTMVAGMLPGAAFAEEPGGTQDQQIVNEDEGGTGTGGDPGQDPDSPDSEEFMSVESVSASRAYNSVPINLTVSSYGAPFINGSTGEHTVTTYKITKYVKRSDVGSDNASGSATGRFVGSNETGWTLYVDLVVGNYTETLTTNARITNKDMSGATGNITFGVSFNTSGGVGTTLRITGGVPLPVEELETKLVYDANGGVNPPAAEAKQVEKGKTGSFTVKGQENMTNGDLIFKGWNTAANGSGTSYSKDDTAVVEAGKTLTLYAQWDNGQTPPPAPTPDLGKLGITKTASVSTVKPGDNFSYTISVANNTGVDLTHVVVRDVLPAGITYVDSTVPAGVAFTGTTDAPAWTIDSIKTGDTVTLTVNVTVAENAVPGKVTNTAKITHIVAGMSEYGEDQLSGATADVEIKSGDGGEEAEVPARVIVEFVGLEPADPLPAAYALTGADTNEFLKGAIALGDEEAAAGLRCRTYNTTVKAVLGQPYTLKFSQSGFNVPGYNCDAQAEVSGNYSAEPVQDDGGGIEVRIRLTYTKQHLITYPEMSVRIYFKGIDSLPVGFNYTLTGAAANPAAPFIGGPLTLRSGMDNGVPYLQLDGGETTLESGREYTFSFTQANYNIDGYTCALGVTEFKFTPEMATDIVNPVLFVATNVYTKDGSGDPDWDGLTITKTANRTYSTCGSTLTYKITVTNKTGIELENIKVLDLLDNNLVYHSSGNGFDPDSGMWVISKLANGKSAELTLRARIKRGLSLGTVVTNTAYLTEVTYNNDPVRLEPWVYAEASVTVVKGAPQTGDDSDLGLWLAVMTASLALAGAAAVVFKKRRSN